MNYQKAIEILGLEPFFSDEKLRKNYRNLARLYHPDKYMDVAEAKRLEVQEKMKEVNAAHDYLEKCFKETGSYHTYYDKDYVKKYLVDKISELIKFLSKSDDIDVFPTYYTTYYQELEKLIEDYSLDLAAAKDTAEVDKIYNEACVKVKEIFIKLKNKFFSIYALDDTYGSKLNYNCSFYDFYKQLKELKNKKLKEVENLIIEAVRDYTLWEYYEFLSSLIKEKIEDSLTKAKKGKFHNLDKIIEELHKEIKNIFALHTNILKRFIDIRNYFTNKYEVLKNPKKGIILEEHLSKEDLEIIKWLNSCIESYQKDCNMEMAIETLKRIENTIGMLVKSDKIKALYEKVLEKFNLAMAGYNESFDTANMKRAMEFFEEFLSVYESLKNGQTDIDKAMVLQNLSFTNFADDNTLFNVVVNANEPDFNLNVYISKRRDNLLESRFFILESETQEYVVLTYFDKDEKKTVTVPTWRFQEYFIALDDYLEMAKYFGKKETYSNQVALYELDDEMLFMDKDGNFNITYNYISYCYEDIVNDNYGNREFIRIRIMEWLQSKLSKERNSSNYSLNGNLVDDFRALLNRKKS
ncbi:MAG: J domain-containing protein [Ruminococcus sp.]|nr:J domain-containing protein [Ruminococcus sp.]